MVHVGSGDWIVVDSCRDSSTEEPAALSYLSQLGVNPSTAVKLVVATHWHDDHISGMADLVSTCSSAEFCSSAALSESEFLAVVEAYEPLRFSNCSSGVREIHQVMHYLRKRGGTNKKAAPDRRVYRADAAKASHGYQCDIFTLSPSDAQVDRFYIELTGLMPKVGRTMRRCVSQGPNHLTVVLWINIGPLSLLLGGDLEETKNPGTGWSVIVNSSTRPEGRASVFKIPHHGSENAHNDDVWAEMLLDRPLAVLTPYAQSHLPKPSDVERIARFTDLAFSTAKVQRARLEPRSQAVAKTLREMNVVIRRIEPEMGLLRLRNGGRDNFEEWSIELLRGACPLSKAHSDPSFSEQSP